MIFTYHFYGLFTAYLLHEEVTSVRLYITDVPGSRSSLLMYLKAGHTLLMYLEAGHTLLMYLGYLF